MSRKTINKVMLMGNLTRDPELRVTPSGASICTFGMATNSSYKTSDGNVEVITNFHNIVAWGKLAEICAQLKKGDKVYVEGELRTRRWEEQGQTKQKTEVRIVEMIIVARKGSTETGVVDDKNVDVPEELNVSDEELSYLKGEESSE